MVELILLTITTIFIGIIGTTAIIVANDTFEKIIISCDTIIGVILGITLIIMII